jgi:DNA-binding NtrC family response regulator
MKATILILDAEEIIRSVITRILEREGYTVHATGDLPSAIDLVKDYTPDLLLTNLYIPGTSGHDAARFLRSMCPNMRVLVVAGLPDDRLIEDRIKGEGFAAFPKPFLPKQLTEKIKDVLEGKFE